MATIKTVNYLKLHGIVLLLALTAILGKLISISPLAVVLYRTLLAALILGLIYFSSSKYRIQKTALLPVLFTGFVLGLHWICFFASARLANVSVSLVTISTISFFTSIIEPLSKKERINKRELFLGLVVVAGMLLIFNFEKRYSAGILVGLVGAVLASIYAVSNVHLIKNHSSLGINFIELFGAFLISLVAASGLLLFEIAGFEKFIPTKLDYFYLTVLAIICTVIPYLILLNLLRNLSAFSVNLTINMEPIYGLLLAWFIFGESERMSIGFYAGAGLIVISIVLHAVWKPKS